MRAVLALLACAGCELVLPLDENPPAPPTGPCSTKATALRDDFDQSELTAGWQFTRNPDNPVMVVQTGVGLEFVFNGIDGAIEVTHDAGFDLRESRFAVAVDLSGSIESANTSSLAFQLRSVAGLVDPDDGIAWQLESDGLVAGTLTGGTFNSLAAPITYDPEAHRFLSFSRTGTTTVWSTSSDGLEFSPAFETTSISPTHFRPALQVIDRNGGGALFGATFRALNTTLATSELCPVAGLEDAFTADDVNTWGHRPNTLCSEAAVDGEIVMTSFGTSFGCTYGTSGLYDAIDSEVVVEGTDFSTSATLPPGVTLGMQMTTLGGATAGFEVDTADSRLVGMVQLAADADPLPVPGSDVPYDPVRHRFWRLRGGTDIQDKQKLFWEVSADGVAFEPLGEFGNLEGFERARVELFMFGAPLGAIGRFAGVGAP